MLAELQLLEEWIPEQMEPGTLFLLENVAGMGEARNPFVGDERAQHEQHRTVGLPAEHLGPAHPVGEASAGGALDEPNHE